MFTLTIKTDNAAFCDESASEDDHSNGDRDHTPHGNGMTPHLRAVVVDADHWHREGGYALRHRWIRNALGEDVDAISILLDRERDLSDALAEALMVILQRVPAIDTLSAEDEADICNPASAALSRYDAARERRRCNRTPGHAPDCDDDGICLTCEAEREAAYDASRGAK
jgi:hypothetical protein